MHPQGAKGFILLIDYKKVVTKLNNYSAGKCLYNGYLVCADYEVLWIHRGLSRVNKL